MDDAPHLAVGDAAPLAISGSKARRGVTLSIESIVIVGAGQGGYQAAASLRQEGFAGTISLVGDEPGLPYQRPPLSKAYMKEGNAERLHLKPETFYASSAIDYRATTRAISVDRANRIVLTESGSALPYDHLVLALGARNAVPPLAGVADGISSGRVMALRTLTDAAALRDRTYASRSAIVVGGGFIGLEYAAVARAAGLDVTVVEAADRLMSRVVSPHISAHFLSAHQAMGNRVLLGVGAKAFTADGVALSDRRHISGDVVLLAAGVRPNVELAAEAGLETSNGIVVDARLLTGDPAISAIGDCALFPAADGTAVRLESVQAAVDHARHVARRLVHGDDRPYCAVPWFWSDQADLKLQIAGLRHHTHRQVVVPASPEKLIVLNLDGDALRAVETVNAAGPHMAARRLLAQGRDVTLPEIEAAGYDLVAMAKALPHP